MLKGQAKKDYQRDYMRRRRMGSNKGLTDGSNNDTGKPNIPLYDATKHRVGDRVLVYRGKRLIGTVIPALDADGSPIYGD